MAKRISQLTNLTSASLDTTLLGVDAGVSYKIELDVLADAVKDRINTIDSIRLGSLENFTASFTASVASGTISGSSQLTSSFDTRYTLSGSVVNVNTSSLVNRLNAIESVSASWVTESETGSFLTSLSGAISSSSQLTSSFDTRYTLSGSSVTINTGSLATTGSNTFAGNQTISTGSIRLLGRRFTDQPKLIISASDDTLRTIVGLNTLQVYSVRDSTSSGINNSFSANISAKVDNQPSASVYFTLATLNTGSLTTGVELQVTINSGSGIIFNDYNTSISGSIPFMRIAPNSGNNPKIEFSRSVDISGSLTSNGFGLISGSSQLTASYDTRYTLSGSVVNGTTPDGTISGSSQLTSSFDGRYTQTGSFNTLTASFNSFTASENTKSTTLATYTSSLNIWTSSVATTGSNSFNGNQTITGSLVVSAVAVVNGGITVPTGSVITLTTGSSISVDSSGAITGSLTGSVFGIGDVVVFSASVNSRIISGSVVAGTISSSAQLTTAFPSKTTGNWSVPAGASTQSLSLDANSSYTMWVNGNIPNGIITWNATATISNTNVPVLGAQYGWYYTVGNALVLTAMPDQFAGTNGSIATTPAAYAPNTSNVFKFGITNNSGTTQTINYGYIKLS